MAEAWRPVHGYEGHYEVSNLGRVRGLDRTLSDGRRWRGRAIRPTPLNFGHLSVSLCRAGKAEPWLVHRLVALAFIGAPPFEGALVRHLNGDPTDNRVANLSWGTFTDNAQDTLRHGNHPNANKTTCNHGHPLEDWNLERWAAKHGGRKCLACTRARSRVQKDPSLDFEEAALWYLRREIERRKKHPDSV